MALKLDKENNVIAGVCSGLAKEFGIDATIIRLAFVIGFVFFGFGPLLYLLIWLVLALSEKN